MKKMRAIGLFTLIAGLVSACGGSGITVTNSGGMSAATKQQQQSHATRTVAWPSLSHWEKSNEAPRDVAVIVAIEDYAFLPDVPGAVRNASDWEAYFRSRGMKDVFVLTDADATSEEMLRMGKIAASAARGESNLWYVFVGHGAPAKDGSTGVLVGMDARQTPDSLSARGVKQNELVKTLETGKQANTYLIVDACFSGRSKQGEALARGTQPVVPVAAAQAVGPKTVVMTAARADQFAGALPAADRPAFSYLLLGALRGWADDGDGKVTTDEAHRWVASQLRHVKGRTQTPELVGSKQLVFTRAPSERDPDVAKLMRSGSATGVAIANSEGVAKIDTGSALIIPVLDGWQPYGVEGTSGALRHSSSDSYMTFNAYQQPKETTDAWMKQWHDRANKVYQRERPRISIEYGGVRTIESEYSQVIEGEKLSLFRWEIRHDGLFYTVLGATTDRSVGYPAFQQIIGSLELRPESTATTVYTGPPSMPVPLGDPATRKEWASFPELSRGWRRTVHETNEHNEARAQYQYRDSAKITVTQILVDEADEAIAVMNGIQERFESEGRLAQGFTQTTVGPYEGWWLEYYADDGKSMSFFRKNGKNIWMYTLWATDNTFAARFDDMKRFIAGTEFQ